MKNLFYIVIVIFLIIAACGKRNDRNTHDERRSQPVRYSNPVDSAMGTHLAFLDSFANDRPFEKLVLLDRINESLIFIQTVTELHAKVDSGPAGPYSVQKEDVIRWKTWYETNKSTLMWDDQTRSIFRVNDWNERAKYSHFVDSTFSAHFTLLDNFINDKLEVEPRLKFKVAQSMSFMERMTGISSKANFGFLRPSTLPKEDITQWKDWYNQNKSNLKWNPTMKTIVRIQK